MQASKESYQSHYETYKGWSVAVQISAHMSRIDADRDAADYIPRVVVTEHDGLISKTRKWLMVVRIRRLSSALKMAYVLSTNT